MGEDTRSNAAGQQTSYWRSDGGGSVRCLPALPLTPRSQNKARSILPLLQPLSIARRSVDEWPCAGSDDVGEWPHPPTPKPGDSPGGVRRDLLASFDKECSKVADHIYLGGDAVARDRGILRRNGITHVLNCVGFVCPEYFKGDIVYKTLWLQDSPTEDITSILYDVFDYFEDVREEGGRLLVHCCQGVSRSTSLVIAYLMWREGQVFEDAFQFVKAARGIANPNMGFACQLLQCQKRVHAVPLSPNSVVRMYHMAPHSPYDALHLVPKMLNEPSPSSLDSRGAFILHSLSSLYLWIGKSCEAVMEKDAKGAAFQVLRYEKVQGPVVIMQEGDEPPDFWDAFFNAPLSSDTMKKVCNEDMESAAETLVGKRKVVGYDGDYELFYKAVAGGVVPPLSSSETGYETHIPARESNWSIMRRKFISGAISRVYYDTVLARDGNTCKSGVQLLLPSPPYTSPSSLTSDSSSSARSSTSDSSSLSPSAAATHPSDTVDTHDFHLSSSKCNSEAVNSPFKGLASVQSIAERRGSFSSLKLPTLAKDTTSLLEKRLNNSSSSLEISNGFLDRKNNGQIPHKDPLDRLTNQALPSNLEIAGDSLDDYGADSSDSILDNGFYLPLQCSQLLCTSSGSVNMSLDPSNKVDLSVYRWPSLERMLPFNREDLDPRGVFLFIISGSRSKGEPVNMLYIWLGSCIGLTDIEGHSNGSTKAELNETNWVRVGDDFLSAMGLPKDVPIKVVKEQDAYELQGILSMLR